MLKKISLFLLILLLSVLLIGCGGGGSTNDSKDAADANTEKVAEEVADVPAGDAEAGETKYQQACLACHGADAKGMPNLGKDLTTSEFVKGQTNAELLAFVKVGRSASDPLNTQGIDMPPKGGNPALTDDDLMNIIAYIRTLEE